jgi:hypothetical protein
MYILFAPSIIALLWMMGIYTINTTPTGCGIADMRRIGVPVVIRITDDMLEVARKLAAAKNKPLRTLLREIIEDVLKEAEK